MGIAIVVAVIAVIILLTVLPGWLRRRRMGAADYEINYDPAKSLRERRADARNWKKLDRP